LKQQGVSDTVLNAMIDQRIRLTGSTEPAVSPQINLAAAQPSVIVQPLAYVQTIPSSTVYVMRDTQTARYNKWFYGHPYAYRCGYGNGFYELPYSYPSISVTIGGGYARAGSYRVHDYG